MIPDIAHYTEYLSYLNFTIQLLWSYFNVVGDVAVHYYSANDVHDDSEDEVDNNCIPKDCDVSRIF